VRYRGETAASGQESLIRQRIAALRAV